METQTKEKIDLNVKAKIKIGDLVDNIKTCPFCESEPMLTIQPYSKTQSNVYISCPKCSLKTITIKADINGTGNPIAKLIELWNMRK